MKRKVLGVFGGVSGGKIAALNSIPELNEWMIESKSVLWPKIALVPCVFTIAAAYCIATAGVAVASAECMRAACTVVAADSMKLSLNKALSSGVSADVTLCDWHIVAGPVATRLGTWIFMGSGLGTWIFMGSGMSSIRACQSREEVNGCDIFSGDIPCSAVCWLPRRVGVVTNAVFPWAFLLRVFPCAAGTVGSKS